MSSGIFHEPPEGVDQLYNQAATGGGQSTQAQSTTHDVLLLGGEARRVFGGSQLILQHSVYGFRLIVVNHDGLLHSIGEEGNTTKT